MFRNATRSEATAPATTPLSRIIEAEARIQAMALTTYTANNAASAEYEHIRELEQERDRLRQEGERAVTPEDVRTAAHASEVAERNLDHARQLATNLRNAHDRAVQDERTAREAEQALRRRAQSIKDALPRLAAATVLDEGEAERLARQLEALRNNVAQREAVRVGLMNELDELYGEWAGLL